MKKILKSLPIFGIILLFTAMGFFLFRAGMESVGDSISIEIAPGGDLQLNNIHFSQDNPEEGIKWFLDANGVRFSKDSNFITFNRFQLKLEPENNPSLQFEGDNGDYNKVSSEINLRGNLNGVSDKGYRIITEHILYRHSERALLTDAPVKITGPLFSVSGKGFQFKLENGTFKINSDVTTLIERESFIL